MIMCLYQSEAFLVPIILPHVCTHSPSCTLLLPLFIKTLGPVMRCGGVEQGSRVHWPRNLRTSVALDWSPPSVAQVPYLQNVKVGLLTPGHY